MSSGHRKARARTVAVTLWTIVAAAGVVAHASGAPRSAEQLRAGVHQQRARVRALSANVQTLSRLIASLEAQIAVVAGREAAVGGQLAADRAALAGVQSQLGSQQRLAAMLSRRLARARRTLAQELVGAYEMDSPDLLTVVLSSRGFTDMLERLDFLRQANSAEQAIIATARADRRLAEDAAQRLGRLRERDQQVTAAMAAQASALAAMNSLLQGKHAALAQARALQTAALHGAQRRVRSLQGTLAALLAAQARPVAAPGAPSGPWAIPTPIVMCESGGQNLPPNGAGASGYYQIIPATWRGMGGSGPAAYLASRAEQDRIAAALWNGGRGASNWVCAALVQGR